MADAAEPSQEAPVEEQESSTPPPKAEITEDASQPEDQVKTASPEATADGAEKEETAKKEAENPAAEDAGDIPVEDTQNKDEEDEKETPVVSASKKTRPPYKFDPDKITLRFLFANRDGLTVTVACAPTDTVGEVKGALLSVWPEDLPSCSGGDRLRLVCMGKGMLMPDSRTLVDCQVPVFKTHPTPVNVSVKPDFKQEESTKKGGTSASTSSAPTSGTQQSSQGCACTIL